MSANPLVMDLFADSQTTLLAKELSPRDEASGVLSDRAVKDLLVEMGRATRCEDIFPLVRRLVEDRLKLSRAVAGFREPSAGEPTAQSAGSSFDVALLNQLKQMHAQLADLQQTRALTARENEVLQAQVFEISGELVAERRSSATAWEQVKLSQREHDQLSTDHARLQESLHHAHDDLEAMEKSREEIRGQLLATEQQLQRLVENARVVCAQRDLLKLEISRGEADRKRLEHSLQNRVEQCQGLQAAIKRVVKLRRPIQPTSHFSRHTEIALGHMPNQPVGASLQAWDGRHAMDSLRQELEALQRSRKTDRAAQQEIADALVNWLPLAQRARYRDLGCGTQSLLRLVHALEANVSFVARVEVLG